MHQPVLVFAVRLCPRLDRGKFHDFGMLRHLLVVRCFVLGVTHFCDDSVFRCGSIFTFRPASKRFQDPSYTTCLLDMTDHSHFLFIGCRCNAIECRGWGILCICKARRCLYHQIFGKKAFSTAVTKFSTKSHRRGYIKLNPCCPVSARLSAGLQHHWAESLPLHPEEHTECLCIV